MDLKKCTGCKTCQLACKDCKNLPVDRNFRRVVEYSCGTWKKEKDIWKNDVFSYYVSVSCNHCDNPACREACPYQAPQIDREREKMTRCDGCKDRVINEGRQPICVESCPLRALDYGPVSEIRKKYGNKQKLHHFQLIQKQNQIWY